MPPLAVWTLLSCIAKLIHNRCSHLLITCQASIYTAALLRLAVAPGLQQLASPMY